MFRTTSDAGEYLERISGLSDVQRRECQYEVDAAARDDLARGTRMLVDDSASMAQEEQDLIAEGEFLPEGFAMVAEAAARPDADAKELALVYDDLVRQASVYKKHGQQWFERASTHNDRIADPAAHYEAFTAKWAEMGTNGAVDWLKSFSW